MNDKTALGDRMKRYEHVPRIFLTPRTPMIIRVDGRAFHTYTRRNFKEHQTGPWSRHMRQCMTAAAAALMGEVSGAKLAYLQSDEISLLVTDFDTLNTEPWFGKGVQKICSVGASVATAAFNAAARGLPFECSDAHFDARCFVLPIEEVTNYFVWRQRDAIRNSILMLAQAHFSAKQMHGKNTSVLREMLLRERGVDWDVRETWEKRGWCVDRRTVEMSPGTLRTLVEPDWKIPHFAECRSYVEQHMRFGEVNDG